MKLVALMTLAALATGGGSGGITKPHLDGDGGNTGIHEPDADGDGGNSGISGTSHS